jgi:hypothetical protein
MFFFLWKGEFFQRQLGLSARLSTTYFVEIHVSVRTYVCRFLHSSLSNNLPLTNPPRDEHFILWSPYWIPVIRFINRIVGHWRWQNPESYASGDWMSNRGACSQAAEFFLSLNPTSSSNAQGGVACGHAACTPVT